MSNEDLLGLIIDVNQLLTQLIQLASCVPRIAMTSSFRVI